MITIKFMLIDTNPPHVDHIEESMRAVPRVHEYVAIGSEIWRVEDVTHSMSTQEISVRAVR